MALALGLKLKLSNLTGLVASVITTSMVAWHKFTASTWSGSNRLPDDSPVGTNTAALYTGRGLSFDGVNDVVTVGNTGVTVKTVVFYAYPDTTTQAFMQLQSTGAVRIEISSGTLSATGFTSPTLYVNGAASSTVAATTWQMIAVTSATGVSASNLLFGQSNTTFYSGDLSNVKMFSTQLNSSQIAELYANPEQALPSGASASDLVGWWPLINGNSSYCFDGSNTRKHGTISGATFINALPSPVSQPSLKSNNLKMYFDKVDDYVSSSTSIGSTSNSFTISLWLFSNTGTTSQIFTNRHSATDMLVLGITAGGGIRAVNYNGSSIGKSVSASSLENGSIHHIAVTCGGALSSDMEIYLDGVAVSDGTSTLGIPSASGWNIGRINGTSNPFGGIVYKTTVWNTPLTSGQISTLYNSGTWLSDETTIQTANVLAAWINTGNTNSDWIDRSGNGKNGTVSGSPILAYLNEGTQNGKDILGTTTENVNSQNLILNATGYALIADAATLDITSAITLEAWVKPFTVSSTQTIIGKNNAYALNITSGAKLQFQRWSSTSSGTVSSSASLTANTWTHVAATYDGTNTKIYINGALDTNSTSISGAIDATATDVLLGALTTSTQLFNGYIDSAKVYSDDLSAANVLNNYTVEAGDYA